MEKDYFQDILPPQGGGAQKPPPRETPPSPEPPPNARSIRNITVTPRIGRRSLSDDMRAPSDGSAPPPPPKPHRTGGRMWIWVIAIVFIAILGGIIALAMRPTTVTVEPRTQNVVLDVSMQFNAEPPGSTGGFLTYAVQTTELEDSAVVAAEGTERVDEKASGTITVVNNYSADPLRLIENTRFETPDGLIFRIAEEIVVPGKTSRGPGELSVTVFADQTGERYNTGPISKFTLPGLRSSPDMYAEVFARSTVGMSGGFSGERPAVQPAALQTAQAEMRGRLEVKARDAAQSFQNAETFVLSDLIRITYTSLPATPEAGGQVRLHEKATVQIPVFPADVLTNVIAGGVSASAEEDALTIRGIENLTAASESTPVLGADPLSFTLSGTAQLIWKVDSTELAEALAGREKAAFQAIVAAFPGIAEARARIQPFWSGTFPTDPSAIQVVIDEPKAPDA